MKNLLITLLAAAATLAATAQTPQTETKPEGYRFTDAKVLEMTPVKNQHRSGTCWCFSTMSFLEGEILRAGGKPVHLSEMWIVRHSFMEKAEKYVRMHGELNFAEGGAAHDVTEGIKKYGIVPFEAYPGLNYGTDKPDFHELTAALKAFLDSVIATADRSGKPLSTAWKRAFNAMLDEYFGHMPDTFVYEGKEYTPQSFAASLPVSMDNYIDITSFTHHPFYTQFVLEVPDNWLCGQFYNVPMEEMKAIVDNALEKGYPVVWAADVSEGGFKWKEGYANMPKGKNSTDMDGTELSRWVKLSDKEREDEKYKNNGPVEEIEVTQELRQEMFDRQETTDDHGMEIIGTAKDQEGNSYYKVKNSWDTNQIYDGFFYVSEPYFLAKTMNIYVNREAIPAATSKKMGLKK